MNGKKASKENIMRMIDELRAYNDTPGEGITRIALTDTDQAARAYIKKEMAAVGLEVREDAAGNIFGSFIGKNPELPPVWTGSHIDTVLNGGAYDGAAGVVCGIEAIRLMKEAGMNPSRGIEVVVFTAEEPTRFGVGCIGSRSLAGTLTWDDARHKVFDMEGKPLAEILNADRERFEAAKVQQGDVSAFVELHIEQAEQLEQKRTEIGIVHTISAPTEMHVSIVGKQRHAGATPMDIRIDPFPALSEISLFLEKKARSFGESSTVATIGRIEVFPNASNVIPARVEFSIDIRSSIYNHKEVLMQELKELVQELERKRGVTIHMETLCDDHPVYADDRIVNAIEAACRRQGHSYMKMASGAYHDAMFMARLAPFGMIFVPSKDGVSHDRAEWTEPEELAAGADVLVSTLIELSR